MDDSKRLSAEGLADYLTTHLKKGHSNVFLIGGHGLGQRQPAGLEPEDVAEAMKTASQRTGVTFDVVVAESCLMGSAEALGDFSGAAKAAVVSEEVLLVNALPIAEMMSQAVENGGDAKAMAKAMVQAAGKNEKFFTMAAVDLDRYELLHSSMDVLGKSLLAECAAGKKEQVVETFAGLETFPRVGASPLEKVLMKFADLGELSDRLQEGSFSDSTKEAARGLREALGDVVMERATSDDYQGVSGLSFEPGENALFEAMARSDSESTGDFQSSMQSEVPDSWKLLMKALKSDIAIRLAES